MSRRDSDLRTNTAHASVLAAYSPRLSMMRVPRWFQFGTKAVVYAFAFVAVGFLLAATLPAFVGFHTVTVYGGSMGSALPAGSVAITRTVDDSQLGVGDIIAFRKHEGEMPTLHRIVAIEDVEGGRLVTTRGDANQTNDPLPTKVSGKGDRVAYHIPWIGYFLHFIRSPLGLALLLGIPFTVWATRQLLVLQRAIRRRVEHRAPGELIASDLVRRGERGGIPILQQVAAIEEADGETLVTASADLNETSEYLSIGASKGGVRPSHDTSGLDQVLAFVRSARGLALLVGVLVGVWAIHEAIVAAIATKRRRSSLSASTLTD